MDKEIHKLQTDNEDKCAHKISIINHILNSDGLTLDRNLKCMFTNARSLASKMGELEALVLEEQIEVVGVAETWLDSSHDWAVNIQGFTLFRRDRANRKGGGVCLYVRSDMKASVKEEIVCDDCGDAETLWVEVQGEENTKKILFGVIYRPPNVTDEIEDQLHN